MKVIVVPDDELTGLEKRFGPGVRQMGSWNSDGMFGYCGVPVIAVEMAAEVLDDPNLVVAVSRLKDTPEQTKPFIELLERFGPTMIQEIVAAYRQCSCEFTAENQPCPKPPKQEIREVSIRSAVG